MIRLSMISRYQLFTLLFLLLASEAPWPCCAETNVHRGTLENEIEESEMDSKHVSVVSKDINENANLTQNYKDKAIIIVMSAPTLILFLFGLVGCFCLYLYLKYCGTPRPAPAQPVPAQPVPAQLVGGTPGEGPGYRALPTQDNQPRPGSPHGAGPNPTPQDEENPPQQEVRNSPEEETRPQPLIALTYQVTEDQLRRRNKSRARMTQSPCGKSHRSAPGHSRSRSRPRLQGLADVVHSNVNELQENSAP